MDRWHTLCLSLYLETTFALTSHILDYFYCNNLFNTSPLPMDSLSTAFSCSTPSSSLSQSTWSSYSCTLCTHPHHLLYSPLPEDSCVPLVTPSMQNLSGSMDCSLVIIIYLTHDTHIWANMYNVYHTAYELPHSGIFFTHPSMCLQISCIYLLLTSEWISVRDQIWHSCSLLKITEDRVCRWEQDLLLQDIRVAFL